MIPIALVPTLSKATIERIGLGDQQALFVMDIDPPEAGLPLRLLPQAQQQQQQRSVPSGNDNVPAPTLPLQPISRTQRRRLQRRLASSKDNGSPAPALSLRSHLQAKQKPPRLHSFSQTRAPQQGALFTLTNELKVNILSYVPAQDILSDCRATCQQLFSFIDGHEKRIADAITKRELGRLQAHSDKLKSFGPPASVKAFLEGVRIFTEQRGFVTMEDHESRVAAKWVRHLFRNVFPYVQNTTGRDDKWAVLAKDFFQLQRSFADDVRRGLPKRDCRQEFGLLNSHWDSVYLHQIMELYELVKATPTNQPYFPGIVHGHEVLERDTWPKLRLTMAYNGKICLHPVVPYELMHLLDLPKLPQDKICFYYVDEEWVCKEIARGPLSPMLKAAVLQLIKIF